MTTSEKEDPMSIQALIETLSRVKVHPANPDFSSLVLPSVLSKTGDAPVWSALKMVTEENVRSFVYQLHKIDELTPSIIFRALCIGDIKFFEYAFSILSDIPIRNTRILMYDGGSMGFSRLYEETRLPIHMFKAFKVAFDTFHILLDEIEGEESDNFQRYLLERMLTVFDAEEIMLNPDDEAFLMKKMELL